jgi:predicted permease
MDLASLIQIFLNNLLPILLISAAGFALGKFHVIDSKSLGRVLFYFFSPILIFDLLTESELSLQGILRMMGFAAAVMVSLALLGWIAGLVLRLDRVTLTAVVLTCLVANNGNYGLPLASFAFGSESLAYASVYYVTTALLFNTVGVVIVSLGHLNLKNAFLSLIKVPAIYAIGIALLFIQTGWQLPVPVQRAVSLAAGGAVPLMLVLLGLELQRTQWTRDLLPLSVTAGLRLLAGPLVGFLMSALFGLRGSERQAGIIQASMPTAVMTTILATEYNIKPELVTAIVFVSTILSPLTLTPLLFVLGS